MRALLVLVGSSLIGAAWAGSLPTDADLKTGYCITVIQRQASFLERAIGTEPLSLDSRDRRRGELQRKTSDLKRLQSYLVPRIPSLEADPLLAARGSANADFDELSNAAGQCVEKCKPFAPDANSGARWSNCVEPCVQDAPAQKRINSCDNINWLPF